MNAHDFGVTAAELLALDEKSDLQREEWESEWIVEQKALGLDYKEGDPGYTCPARKRAKYAPRAEGVWYWVSKRWVEGVGSNPDPVPQPEPEPEPE